MVVAFPAHTSHRTQGLDYSIFSPFNTYLRNALNDRVLTTAGAIRNDISTLCDLVHDAYKRALAYSNIVSGFSRVGCGVQGASELSMELSNLYTSPISVSIHLEMLPSNLSRS